MDKDERGSAFEPFRDGAFLLAVGSAVILAIVALYDAGVISFFGLPYGLNEPDPREIFNVLGNVFKVAFHWPINPLITVPIIVVLVVSDGYMQRRWIPFGAIYLLCFLATPWIAATWQIIPVALLLLLSPPLEEVKDVGPEPGAAAGADGQKKTVPTWYGSALSNLGRWPLSAITLRFSLIALVLIPDAYFAGQSRFQTDSAINVAYIPYGKQTKPVAILRMTDLDHIVGVSVSPTAAPVGAAQSWQFAPGTVLYNVADGATVIMSTCRMKYVRIPTSPRFWIFYGDDGSIGQNLAAVDPKVPDQAAELRIDCAAAAPQYLRPPD